jgi:hypothetical protein
MDKKIAGLLGAAAALTAANSAQAAAPSAQLEPAASYRDLLEPVPNALAMLKAEDAQGTTSQSNGQTQLAEYPWWRRYYRHHHHHHLHHHHHHHHHY